MNYGPKNAGGLVQSTVNIIKYQWRYINFTLDSFLSDVEKHNLNKTKAFGKFEPLSLPVSKISVHEKLTYNGIPSLSLSLSRISRQVCVKKSF